ncbi:HlyD family efflux transporter periplasmic adaptor subunit [Niveibacterium sp. 24ML]|uniref:HlyD family efflux transporter periplasmic adaptor subunit n=1 Tax=Niveibacterium sp. 24ML TaxID=2985512 RepID=UPI00227034E4|nr:HlyD family efflux transporter periplasmic adaptor subunit [Niveibacterium sp. 24ML]MCX9157049.1 HlyD family efflux transporter periplasmic adaptor subunit [Niveibacterium sp. 24ML]
MSQASATTATGSHRKRILMRVAGGFIVLALAALLYWALVGRFSESTDNAYVGGNLVQIAPQVSGSVSAVLADDTDFVQAGDPLVRLDDADARVALSAAEAALAEAVRGVRGLYVGENQSRAQVDQRRADVERLRHQADQAEIALRQARDEYARREKLQRDQFISPEALQSARTALQAAEAAHLAARSAVSESESGLTQAREQKAGAQALVDNTSLEMHPRVAAAAAKVREASLALARTTIVAPVSGHIAKRTVQVGARVTAGTPLMTIVPPDQLWVDANFKETELANVRIGQPVSLRADLYGGDIQFKGSVVGLAAGTGGVFSVLPAQNASGNWIKIVQRVPVRVALDPAELAAHPLRVGLSMRARIDTHDRGGAVLAKAARTHSQQQTEVFAAQSHDADARIARIVAANRASEARK